EAEEAERAALETVRDFLIAAPDFDQIVAIAGLSQQLSFLRDRLAGERVAFRIVEREQLGLARLRDRHRREKFLERLGGTGLLARVRWHGERVARDQHVAPERLAREEYAARELE